MVEKARAVMQRYRLDKESDCSSASVGAAIGWRSLAPTGQLGIGGGKRRSDLVRFISGITGSDVTLVSRKITADLNQILAKQFYLFSHKVCGRGRQNLANCIESTA